MDSPIPTRCGADDALVLRRIREKKADYENYAFDVTKSRVFNIFFDLCQEFRNRDNFYSTVLLILREILGVECALYILEDEETFVLASCSDAYAGAPEVTRTWNEGMPKVTTHKDGLLYIPVRCNPEFNDMLPFRPPDNILGMLIVALEESDDQEILFFLDKFANRVGFQLHNRILQDKSREHLDFIRNLVEDIGHNVIVPNIYFKLYFNRLKRLIDSVEDLKEEAEGCCEGCGENLSEKLGNIHEAMHGQYEEIYRHYVQTSMFLETLLRRRHFEEGRYVLEKRPCNLRRQVIEPQLDRYRHRFEERDIQLDMSLGAAPDQSIRMFMDVGLISQVYANLFSNALKYTGETTLPDGRTGKFVSFGWKVLKDYFGKDLSGIRLFVFSTGKPLNPKDPMDLFAPGFRAENIEGEQGSGHGLYFVRQVVELHRGEVVFRPTQYGNEISFILPYQVGRNDASGADMCVI